MLIFEIILAYALCESWLWLFLTPCSSKPFNKLDENIGVIFTKFHHNDSTHFVDTLNISESKARMDFTLLLQPYPNTGDNLSPCNICLHKHRYIQLTITFKATISCNWDSLFLLTFYKILHFFFFQLSFSLISVLNQGFYSLTNNE